ncbi:hypothetical protein M409DRAFT_30868 [Zasmidium cellare ATCC 36951]|uniref:Heterokaryon incompatibility domain-containing protein n=1 Tax=Zasmidium cellare ATCC 36951 TaxID=1080233 RepID=A0A6A6BVS4_ZASCE|nr:uncharacterized protein M409DRAFT_30868 [Zasmidium cellare ATCC 36951]KAF2158643.1 hypothetical protein M409DRAFT_30868 [Zasmidium cellare ATCC 36951]
MSLEPYQHEPLPDSRRYIRLVKIHPASNKDPLTISVKAYERTSAPEYTALSYTWRDRRLTKGISANGRLLLITENCWYALGQLRLKNFGEYCWVDTICINQADNAEKSAQVDLMGAIYQNAALCAIAVGRHDRTTGDLFRLMKGLGITRDSTTTKANLAQLDHETLESLARGLIALGTHPCWSHLWIVQEFALPSNVVLLRGSSSVPFDIIAAVNNGLREILRGTADPKFVTGNDHTMLESTPMSATMRLRRIIRGSPKGLLTFEKLLDLLGPRDCDDIRDRIFGILSLVQRSDGVESLAADYSLSRTELAIKTLRLCSGAQLEVASRVVRLLDIGRGDRGMLKIRQHRMLSHDHVPTSRPLSVGQRARFGTTVQAFRITDQTPLFPWSDRWRCLMCPLQDSPTERTTNNFTAWLRTRPIMVPAD